MDDNDYEKWLAGVVDDLGDDGGGGGDKDTPPWEESPKPVAESTEKEKENSGTLAASLFPP